METYIDRGPYQEDVADYWPLFLAINPETGILTIVCDSTETPEYTDDLEAGFKQRVEDLLRDVGINWSGVTGKESPVSSGMHGPSYWQITAQLETVDPCTTLGQLLTTEVMDKLRKQIRPTCETRAAVLVSPVYSDGIYTNMLIHLEPAEGAPPFVETAAAITDEPPASPRHLHLERTPRGGYRCVLPQPFKDPVTQAMHHALAAGLKLGAIIVDYELTDVPRHLQAS